MLLGKKSVVTVFPLLTALSLLPGCKPDGFASRQADAMTSRDVHGSARLSADERKAHVDNCIGQKRRLVATFSWIKRINSGGTSKLPDELDRYVPPFCECLVNQVEDRGSKMQLLMAMSALEQVGLTPWSTQGPDFSAFRAAAKRHGMSGGAFEHVHTETRQIHASAAKLCVRHVRNA